MQWKKLLQPGRLGCPATGVDDTQKRLEAQRDFDRIVFSPAFRRLQGKTQVFPLPESDMTHTRLTHSLEVSCVGRSLGWIAANRIDELKDHKEAIAASIAAAALAHDIGNPPFGHCGEKAIGFYFEHGDGNRFLKGLSKRQTAELKAFEGNALGFRLLVNSKPVLTENVGGFSLTNITLASFSKYPCCADLVDAKMGVSRKKYGIFHDDLKHYSEIANSLGISSFKANAWHRHPFAFLTEAADDICYGIIDLEDGFRLGLVTYDETEEILREIAIETAQDLVGLQQIRSKDQRVGFLRSKAVNSLIEQCVAEFIKGKSALLSGKRELSLFDSSKPQSTLKRLKMISREKIYSYQSVLEIEAAGFNILSTLLECFLDAIVGNPNTERARKYRSLIPPQYLSTSEYKHGEFSKSSQMLNICEFVASMTDEFAISMFRKLKGISLPNSRP